MIKQHTLRLWILTAGLLVLLLVLILPNTARAITFGEWATAHGYDPGDVMPDTVEAWISSIDSLDGIGDYDWMTEPTTCLSLFYNQITSIESGTFQGLDDLVDLDLANNQITSIESGDFSRLGNLTDLDLGNNRIASIESDSFAGLGSLTSLQLGANEIPSIGSCDFTGLSSLTSLNIGSNQITSIKSGDFTGLGSLTFLNVAGNQITNIESGGFTGLDSLTRISLMCNEITSIEAGDFSGLGNLMYLELGLNRITSIEADDFTGLDSLTNLSLASNKITSVEPGDLAGLDNLTALSLASNKITSIESGIFAGLNKLEWLYLYKNEITSVESDRFNELESLIALYLNDNKITNIESGVFVGLDKLQRLYLENNPDLTTLDFERVRFSDLAYFDVSNNTNISSVSLKNATLNQKSFRTLIDGGSTNCIGFGELPAVAELDLSGMDFSEITVLSPLWSIDELTDLWLIDVKNLDPFQLDTLLNYLDAMEDPNTEGTLYMTADDFESLNTAGGGLLAAWDAELGHHVEIVPEPSALILLCIGAVCLLTHRRS